MQLIRDIYTNINNKGVTLLEILASIIIFGFGILTIMSLIISNISWVKTIRVKDTATMLAKEGLEIVYHLRDSNLEKGLYRYCAELDESAGDNCGSYFYQGGFGIDGATGTNYIISGSSADLEQMYTLETISSSGDAWLYLHTGNLAGGSIEGFWYDHNPIGGERSQYKRYITIKPSPDYSNATGKILQVESFVIIHEGNKQREILLESLIGDTRSK